MRLNDRPRGHRPAAEREDDADARQGDAAARRVQPRPDRSGDEEPARPAGRPRARARAGPAGALPPHEEQRRAHRRAGRRQDGHRRGAGAEDRLRRRAALPGRQAHPRARHLADRRRHEVSRPVRRAPQGDHEGAHREPEHHRVHRRAAHAGRRRLGRGLARRRQHPEAGALARRDPLHRRDHARPSTRKYIEKDRSLERRFQAIKVDPALREGNDRNHPGREGPLRVLPPRRVHARRRSRRPSTSRTATSPTASCPTRPSTSIDEAGARAKLREAGYSEEFGEINKSIRVAVEQMETAVFAEGLREGAVLPRAGSAGAREPAVRSREVRRQVEHAPGRRRQAGDRRGRLEVDRRADHLDQPGRRATSCCGWSRNCTAASSARRRPSPRSRAPSAARGPGSRPRTARSAASSSSGRPASARPSWRARWPTSCSAATTRSSASTCPSTWRSTRCRS